MMMSGELSIKQNRMTGISVPKIACLHHADDHIITENYEIVCKRCGVVLGTDNSQEIATESTLNLFHEIEPGTKPVKIDCTKRTHEHRSDTSLFSNACDKLDLPRYCYLEAWNTYTKLRNNTTYSKADIASFALFTPSILDPNIAISVTKENLTDSDGYTIRNLDGTYYLWDAINVIHKPIYRWQNERGGTLETVTTKKYDITNEKEFECQKKSAGTCDYTLEHSHVQSWNKVFDHGAGLTIYNGTSDKDLGRHFFQYKIDLFNIGRYLNTTSGFTDTLIVRYDPVYQNYAYNMLKDDHWWAYGNRPAVALHYYGSIGGGPDDSSGIHEFRRSKLNGFDYSGYAFDPVNKVFLNEAMTWNSAEPITLQSITFDDRCNKEVNFDPSSFEVLGLRYSSKNLRVLRNSCQNLGILWCPCLQEGFCCLQFRVLHHRR